MQILVKQCLSTTCHEVAGDLEHLLIVCPALHNIRQRIFKLWLDRTASIPVLHNLVRLVLASSPTVQVKFILDPCTFPDILMLLEIYGQPLLEHVCYLTRTFAYYIHREKQISLGRWPGDPGRRRRSVTKIPDLQLLKTVNNTSNPFLITGPGLICPDATTTSDVPVPHFGCQARPQTAQCNTTCALNDSTHQIVTKYGCEDCAGLGLPGDCGVASSGVAPDGVAPDGVAPDGVAPGGVAPDGVAPGGVVYAAAHAARGGRQGGDAGVCSGGDRVASNIIISQCIADCCVPMA